MPVSVYGADLLSEVITGQTTVPANLYLALSTVQVDTTYLGSNLAEPSGGSYARLTVPMDNTTWGDSNNGFVSNNIVFNFPTATADWGVIYSWALCTTSTVNTGDIVYFGAFALPYEVANTQKFSILQGELGIGISTQKVAI